MTNDNKCVKKKTRKRPKSSEAAPTARCSELVPATLGSDIIFTYFFQALCTLTPACRKGAQSEKKRERGKKKKAAMIERETFTRVSSFPGERSESVQTSKFSTTQKYIIKSKKCRRKIIHHSSSYVFICFFVCFFFSSDHL